MISVIIPIYNVEKQLPGCIESVISQEYSDLEIILVDDGSTDSSGKICDEYAKKDTRIKVIHKKNGGASDARNVGIKASSGDYVALLDGDDRISPNMYARLLNVINETSADIVECKYIKTSDLNLKLNETETTPQIFDAQEAVKEIIFDRVLTQTPVNKLYKREIILKIPFVTGMYVEDEFWTYKIFSFCKKIALIDERLYYYYQREGSFINSDYSIKRLDGLKALYERIEFVEKRFPSLVPYARSSYMGNCFYAYQRLAGSKNNIDKDKYYRKEIHKSFCEEWEKERVKPSTAKGKIWYFLFKHMPGTTCRVRNKLKIGL